MNKKRFFALWIVGVAITFVVNHTTFFDIIAQNIANTIFP